MDLYLPAGQSPAAVPPAVLLVHGEARPELLRGVRGWASTPAGAGCWPPRAWPDRRKLNHTIDEFVAAAGAGGLPVELVDLPDAHHAFDTVDDTEPSRAAIRRVLGFLRRHVADGR
jgi:acetyl esterase/lipase